MAITRKDLATHYGINQGTIRSWERRWPDLFTSSKAGFGQGQRKAYNDNDIRLIEIITRGRDAGRGLDDIGATLEAELATFTDDRMPDIAGTGEDDSSQAGALVVDDEAFRQMQLDLAAATGSYKQLESERDRLLDDLAAERDARLEAERQAARLEGQLAAQRTGFWRRLFWPWR